MHPGRSFWTRCFACVVEFLKSTALSTTTTKKKKQERKKFSKPKCKSLFGHLNGVLVVFFRDCLSDGQEGWWILMSRFLLREFQFNFYVWRCHFQLWTILSSRMDVWMIGEKSGNQSLNHMSKCGMRDKHLMHIWDSDDDGGWIVGVNRFGGLCGWGNGRFLWHMAWICNKWILDTRDEMFGKSAMITHQNTEVKCTWMFR